MQTVEVNYITAVDVLMERYRTVDVFSDKRKALEFAFEDTDDADSYGIDLIAPFMDAVKVLAIGKYEGKQTEFYKPYFIYGDLRLFYIEHLYNYIKKHGGNPLKIYIEIYDFEAKKYGGNKNG